MVLICRRESTATIMAMVSMEDMGVMGDMVAILMVVMVTTEIIATAIMEIKMTIL